MRVCVGGSERIVALLAMNRLGRPVRQHFLQELFTFQDQGDGRGDMTVPPAVTTLSVSEQHIQPSAWQVVAEQAVLEIDPEVFAVRLGTLCITLAGLWYADRDGPQGVFLQPIAQLLARKTTRAVSPSPRYHRPQGVMQRVPGSRAATRRTEDRSSWR